MRRTSVGTRSRRVIACVMAVLLAMGLLPVLPQATYALAEEPGAVLELVDGSENDLEVVDTLAPDGAVPVSEDVVVLDDVADEPDVEIQTSALGVENPRAVPDESMKSGQVVTWDCVWLGSYPQGEVAPGDVEYDSLQGAAWDANGDATVGGKSYRRISRPDTTSSAYWPDDAGEYRYFRYEPIK